MMDELMERGSQILEARTDDGADQAITYINQQRALARDIIKDLKPPEDP